MSDQITLTNFFEPVIPFIKSLELRPAEGIASVEIDVSKIELNIETILQYFNDDAVVEFQRGFAQQMFKGTFKDYKIGMMVREMMLKPNYAYL